MAAKIGVSSYHFINDVRLLASENTRQGQVENNIANAGSFKNRFQIWDDLLQ